LFSHHHRNPLAREYPAAIRPSPGMSPRRPKSAELTRHRRGRSLCPSSCPRQNPTAGVFSFVVLLESLCPLSQDKKVWLSLSHAPTRMEEARSILPLQQSSRRVPARRHSRGVLS